MIPQIIKNKRIFLCYSCLLILINVSVSAQESNCENLGFELGNFTNWTGYSWLKSTEVPSINTSKKAGIVNRRHTIMSDTSAYDEKTGYALRKIPEGYMYSARLGDEITSSDGNPRCWQQSLQYTMTIDSSNALLIFKYACVLQYASDHTALVEPRFRLTLYDEDGNEIDDCSNYDVYATSSGGEGFNIYTIASSNNNNMGPGGGQNEVVNWRDWTTVGANLMAYYGQTITIEFMATDCTGRYHYGYAYFVAACHPLNIVVDYCTGDTVAKLTAPDGFETYEWTDSNDTEVDTSQSLIIADPEEGEAYTCTMKSETGCIVALESSVAKYMPLADFTSEMIDCKSNTVKFTNQSTGTNGTLQYIWDFGDSTSSMSKSPYHTFSTSGMHPMKLIVLNPPSSCTDTLDTLVESFSPPLVGIEGDSTYCPGESVTLTAYGAYNYTWNTASNADSIEISSPGGVFWMFGNSSTGCVSDTIYINITEQEAWEFLSEGDTTFCAGDSVTLKALGSVSYLWNTGDTANSIVVSNSGLYSVHGSDVRGCEKELSFNVFKYPLPAVEFDLSPEVLNRKYNQLAASITPEDNVGYYWDLGDGSTETSSEFEHTYNITGDVKSFPVTLIATTEHNCTDTASKIIYVVPFVPNVFSPNNDGINDVFMSGYEIEIFDRNGLLLHKGTGWDGMYNGVQADPDTYFYVIKYQDENEKTGTKKGFVTLVR